MTRTFTLSEAEALLPHLDRLLATVIKGRERLGELETMHEAILARIMVLGGVQLDPLQLAEGKRLRNDLGGAVRHAMEEIAGLGVQVKDLETGLLDFPSLRDGRVVLLCWRRGETHIAHWHGTDEGYAQRKPIAPDHDASAGGKSVQ